MTQSASLVWWVIGLIAIGLIVLVASQFSQDARLRRRRRRNNTRIITKAKGPSVRFSVRPPKE
jgi:hypothetical protein